MTTINKKALIIDDSVTMRSMVAMTLTRAGFDVIEAENGAHGLQQISGRQVDVIISDLNMPVMDGFDFVRAVRERPEGRGIPILMLTTEARPEMKLKGKAAGATGWIVKPFDPTVLLKTLARVIP